MKFVMNNFEMLTNLTPFGKHLCCIEKLIIIFHKPSILSYLLVLLFLTLKSMARFIPN